MSRAGTGCLMLQIITSKHQLITGHTTSSLCYARRWRVDLLGYPHPLDARDDATSALSRNGTTQADPSRNLETTRLTSSGGREPATGTTRPKFIDPWLDHHGGPSNSFSHHPREAEGKHG